MAACAVVDEGLGLGVLVSPLYFDQPPLVKLVVLERPYWW